MASEDQCARASRCARQLGCRTPVPHSLYRAMLELVVSVEKPGAPEPAKKPPVSDARKVLAPPKRPASPRREKKPKEPIQEELTLW